MKNPLLSVIVLILATIVVGINSCTLVCGCVQGPDYATLTIRSERDSTALAVEVDSLEVTYIVQGQKQALQKKAVNRLYELRIAPQNQKIRLSMYGLVSIPRDKAVNDFTLEWRGRAVATFNVKITPSKHHLGDYAIETFRVNNVVMNKNYAEIEIPDF